MNEIAYTVLVFSFVATLGLAIGKIKFFGIHIGIAGVLFAGIFVGHYLNVNKEVLEFIREFGLILFVYTIGIQVGPGFFSSLKKDGLKLNMLAATAVVGSVIITILLIRFAGIPVPAAIGMFSGATTNTPSLGAAQQALKEIPDLPPEMLDMPGLGYAVAYPFGIMGIILTMIILRLVFRINTNKESEKYASENLHGSDQLVAVDLQVDNPSLNGVPIKKIPFLKENGFVVSRILHNNQVMVALGETIVYVGDVIRVVGHKEKFEEVKLMIGRPAALSINLSQNEIQVRQVVITKHEVEGKMLLDLQPRDSYGVNVTRIQRAETELPVTSEVAIHLADVLTVVGKNADIERFAAAVGNAPKHLDHPLLIPIFIGIGLGVLLGSVPFSVPGIPSPVKLGLAGGPLLVAIILSRIGRIGKVVWYMPISANYMLREFGIVLFLACVGLKSGNKFFDTLLQGPGLYWMGCAVFITLIPLLVIGFYAQMKLKMNYLTICGVLAGSLTDPPALAFANGLSSSSAASIGYTSVYPLVMVMRILSAQILVLLFM